MRRRILGLLDGLVPGGVLGGLCMVGALGVGGACWRDAPQAAAPQRSFVARVNAMAELRRGTEDVERRTQATMQRILGLASEAEREAIHSDLLALERDVVRLGRILEAAREDGEDRDQLGELARKLDDATVGVVQLRAELRHAKTTAELEAFEELKRKVEGTHDMPAGRRLFIPRDSNVPPVLLPGDRKQQLPELPPLRP